MCLDEDLIENLKIERDVLADLDKAKLAKRKSNKFLKAVMFMNGDPLGYAEIYTRIWDGFFPKSSGPDASKLDETNDPQTEVKDKKDEKYVQPSLGVPS